MHIIELPKMQTTVVAEQVAQWWRTRRNNKRTPWGVVLVAGGYDRRAYFETERERDECLEELEERIGAALDPSHPLEDYVESLGYINPKMVDGPDRPDDGEAVEPGPDHVDGAGQLETPDHCALCGESSGAAPMVVDLQGVPMAICPECQQDARSPTGGLYASTWETLEQLRRDLEEDLGPDEQ